MVEPVVSNLFFFWIPIVLFLGQSRRSAGVLFLSNTALQPAKEGDFQEENSKEKRNAHHNLVCRIEPMQARQKDV